MIESEFRLAAEGIERKIYMRDREKIKAGNGSEKL